MPATLLPSSSAVDDAAHVLASRLRASVPVIYHDGGSGSGTIWPGEGLIITNHHVVPGEGARVLASDGVTHNARVIARDPSSDLALLHVRDILAGPLEPRTGALRAGELVYAMGNPWGERGALTVGVVLGGGSGPRGDGAFAPVRADLRLAPGNSGGPMVDAQGRIVGINSMIVGGVAVAIPAAVVEAFVERAIIADSDTVNSRTAA